jgi:predicted amidohydrolase/predicted N-acetyltransferase YhbS
MVAKKGKSIRHGARLVTRQATPRDIPEIQAVMRSAYPNMPIYPPDQLQGQMNNFPEGQFVAVYDGRIVGYCATFIAREADALVQHTWRNITGGGFASRHTALGEWLYGMEVFVDPAVRGMRIGRRLYDERRRLCQAHGLRGIVIAGRLPRLARFLRQGGTAEQYLEEVKTNRRRDPVATFQIANEFEVRGLLRDYLPSDVESGGYASLMVWRNPQIDDTARLEGRRSNAAAQTVRVALAQYAMKPVASFDAFAAQVRFAVETAVGRSADFLLLPEYFTLQLLSIDGEMLDPAAAIRRMTGHAPALHELLAGLAVRRNINIVAGSQLVSGADGIVRNICRVYLRDGAVHEQTKLHPTPDESRHWGVVGGTDLDVIPTDCGPIGVAICYDSEFPEVTRHLVDQGARILFVPTCTDSRQAFMRVRHCAAARAIENQCFMAVAGTVGNLDGIGNLDVHYAQSCVLTPCDVMFPPDGVALELEPNSETVGVVDLQISNLWTARNAGAVQNLRDRRFDLYSVRWHADA